MPHMPAEQAGFRRGYSTRDHIMTVNLLMEKALESFGVDDCTIRMIKQIYAAGRSFISIGEARSEFEVQRGVRQGNSLSPLLFILTLQWCINSITWNGRGYKIGINCLTHLAYADDLMLCSASVNELQSMVSDLVEATRNCGLEVNVEKTKWMSSDVGQRMRIDQEGLEQVRSFVYLGQLLTMPRDHNIEIGRRISSAWNIYNKVKNLLQNRLTPMKTKRRFFHVCIIPALLYGCETWALTKRSEVRLRNCQRKMERRMMNIRLLDKVPSSTIRRRTKLKDVVKEYRRRKWYYAARLGGLDSERWEKRLLTWRPPSTRPLGRPRRRWEDPIRKVAGPGWMDMMTTTEWTRRFTLFSSI